MIKKHAYLVLVHKDINQLLVLLNFIDDYRNDIYIHFDQKMGKIPLQVIRAAITRSRLFLVDRIKVSWGGYSVIHAEMNLINAAVKRGGYSYYHLLSGLDLPVKSQDYIHDFFERHDGEVFLEPVDYEGTSRFRLRYEQFHLLQDLLIGRKRNIWKYFDFASCYVQRFLGIHRFEKDIVRAAWQWFSLPDDCVKFIASKSEDILRKWRYTYCCDELFIPTEIAGTEFERKRSPLGSLRYAQWEWQGMRDYAPRILTEKDLDLLRNPYVFFARKFTQPDSSTLIGLLLKDFGRNSD